MKLNFYYYKKKEKENKCSDPSQHKNNRIYLLYIENSNKNFMRNNLQELRNLGNQIKEKKEQSENIKGKFSFLFLN